MNSALAVEGEHSVLPLRPSSAERSSQEALERKRVQYAELYSQFQQGKSIAAIVRTADVHRATVHKAIRCQGQVFRRRHARPSGILTPFCEVLQNKWDAGCHNASQLYRELVQAGYAGSSRRVILWAQERREVPAPTTPAHSEYRQCETARLRQTPKTSPADDSQIGVLAVVFASR